VLVQAGASGPGRDLAARHADVVFTAGATMEEAVSFYDDIKARAGGFGRGPTDIAIMPGISPIVGGTEEEAKAMLERANDQMDTTIAVNSLQNFMPDIDLSAIELDAPVPDVPVTQGQQSRQKLAWDAARREGLTMRQLARRFAGTRGHNTVFGTPEQIADAMAERFQGGGCDGFNIMPYLLPTAFTDFTEQVVPVLQKRGLFREDYEGTTLRDHLGLDRPALD
jgi:alkanesulfonate monooxygenase SsuD/methylene tetrahydromethanopterin reductase-like flavin-dependent oxidoreductase (luciferase family)